MRLTRRGYNADPSTTISLRRQRMSWRLESRVLASHAPPSGQYGWASGYPGCPLISLVFSSPPPSLYCLHLQPKLPPSTFEISFKPRTQLLRFSPENRPHGSTLFTSCTEDDYQDQGPSDASNAQLRPVPVGRAQYGSMAGIASGQLTKIVVVAKSH